MAVFSKIGAIALALTLAGFARCDEDLPTVEGITSNILNNRDQVLSVPLTRVHQSLFPETFSRLKGRYFQAGVSDIIGAAYLADITVGTGDPSQKIQVLLDTGSYELWVNPNCTKSSVPDLCETFGKYDPTLSPTSQNLNATTQIRYGSGTVNISYFTDEISISSGSIQTQQFGVATDSERIWFGIMGLGYGRRQLGQTKGSLKYNSVIDNIYDQRYTNSRLFGLELGPQGKPQIAVTGQIIFGGVDTNKYAGNLSKIPLEAIDNHYRITLSSISHRTPDNITSTITETPVIVIMDSGTTLSILPRDVVETIASKFPGAIYGNDGTYTVPCTLQDQPGSLDFKFGSNTVIRVPYSEFVWGAGSYEGSDMCLLGVQWNTAASPDPTAKTYLILGDTFMRAAYTVFDQDNTALYIANYTTCGTQSAIVAVPAGVDAAARIPGNCGPPTASPSVTTATTGTSVTPISTGFFSSGDTNPVGPVSMTPSIRSSVSTAMTSSSISSRTSSSVVQTTTTTSSSTVSAVMTSSSTSRDTISSTSSVVSSSISSAMTSSTSSSTSSSVSQTSVATSSSTVSFAGSATSSPPASSTSSSVLQTTTTTSPSTVSFAESATNNLPANSSPVDSSTAMSSPVTSPSSISSSAVSSSAMSSSTISTSTISSSIMSSPTISSSDSSSGASSSSVSSSGMNSADISSDASSTVDQSTLIESAIVQSTTQRTTVESTTTSTPAATVTSLPEGSFIFGVLADGGAARNRTAAKRSLESNGMTNLDRRQSDGGFIGGAGPANPASCSDASGFDLTDGQLTSGGELVVTEPGVASMVLRVSPAGGSINTTLAVVGGVLHWFNDAFYGGEAAFCQDAGGRVNVVFTEGGAPAGCAEVSVIAYPASQCRDGELVLSVSASTTPSSSDLTTAAPTSSSTATDDIVDQNPVVQVTKTNTITSTVTTLVVYTITECPPSVQNCPLGQVATSTQVLVTAICTEEPTSSTPAPTQAPSPSSSPAVSDGGNAVAVVVAVTVTEECETRTFAVSGRTTTATYTRYRTVTATVDDEVTSTATATTTSVETVTVVKTPGSNNIPAETSTTAAAESSAPPAAPSPNNAGQIVPDANYSNGSTPWNGACPGCKAAAAAAVGSAGSAGAVGVSTATATLMPVQAGAERARAGFAGVVASGLVGLFMLVV